MQIWCWICCMAALYFQCVDACGMDKKPVNFFLWRGCKIFCLNPQSQSVMYHALPVLRRTYKAQIKKLCMDLCLWNTRFICTVFRYSNWITDIPTDVITKNFLLQGLISCCLVDRQLSVRLWFRIQARLVNYDLWIEALVPWGILGSEDVLFWLWCCYCKTVFLH
jgi:hypothetical protein